MRALKLDFARHSSRLRYVGYVMLIGAVVVAANLAAAYVDLATDLETSELKWRKLKKTQSKESRPAPEKKAEWEQLQAELKAANRVLTRLSMPWDALFQEMEASIDEQVALLSVEPDTEKRELRITAEAKNLGAMLAYMKRLQAIALFKDAHVSSHQIQLQDPQRPVRFMLSARWDF